MGTNNHCAFILYQTFSLSRDILYKLKAHGPTIIASMSILQIQWVWATILYDMYRTTIRNKITSQLITCVLFLAIILHTLL